MIQTFRLEFGFVLGFLLTEEFEVCIPVFFHVCRVLQGGISRISRGGGNWGTLRIPREDWGTLREH